MDTFIRFVNTINQTCMICVLFFKGKWISQFKKTHLIQNLCMEKCVFSCFQQNVTHPTGCSSTLSYSQICGGSCAVGKNLWFTGSDVFYVFQFVLVKTDEQPGGFEKQENRDKRNRNNQHFQQTSICRSTHYGTTGMKAIMYVIMYVNYCCYRKVRRPRTAPLFSCCQSSLAQYISPA